MHLMPAPVPSAGDNFLETWNRHVNMLAALDENGQHAPTAKIAEKELSSSIAWSRTAVIEVLQMVD